MEIPMILLTLVEIVIIALGLLIAVTKKKAYGWLIAISFALYVVADAIAYLGLSIDVTLLDGMKLLAAPIFLIALLMWYKEK